jgi:tetratricopeptide (TPR) repeat protein
VDYLDDVEEGAAPSDVDRLLGLSRQDSSSVIRHLLAIVPDETLAGGERVPRPRARHSGEGARYDEAFRRTEHLLTEAHERVRRERSLAIVQWATLEGHPYTRQLVMVRNDQRLHHWGLYDLLLEKSREAATRDRDTGPAVSLAEMALAVAERLTVESYGEERLADFKTAALTALGDARRTAGDLAGARLAFSQARIQLEMGTGDLMEEANLLGTLTSLLCDLGEYGKAASSLERATALYHRLGDDRLDGASIPWPVEDDEDQENQASESWARGSR